MQKAYFLSFILLFAPCLEAALPGGRESAPSPIDALRYTLRSQQSDLKMLQERLNDYDEHLDLLRSDFKHAFQQQTKTATDSLQKMQESQRQLMVETNALRQDLTLMAEHVKQLHELIESLQAALQQQTKKTQVLEKTLSTLVNSLGSSVTMSSDGKEHKVQAGETLGEIAQKYGTSIKLLKEHNHLDTDRIRVGQILKIP